MITDTVDVKAALTEGLTELHLPTVKRVYEEAARLAQRETLSYERYLLDLVTWETHDRQQKRIQRLLRQSRIPAEKSLIQLQSEKAATQSGASHEITKAKPPHQKAGAL